MCVGTEKAYGSPAALPFLYAAKAALASASGYAGGKFAIKERLGLEVRAEAFNAFNNHYFTCDGQAFGDCIPFNNDPSSASFGSWNGTVTQPRNIQLVGRITF